MASEALHAGASGRREFQRFLALSALGHAMVLAVLLLVPSPSSWRPLPPVVEVELVALGQPRPHAPRRPAPRAPTPPAAKRPAPAKAPAAPPRPKAKKIVLPAKPKAKPVAPRARERHEPAPAPKPSAPSYEDVLAKLRAEQGEPAPPNPAETAKPSAQEAGAGVGRPAPAEVVAWVRAARLRVRRAWVLPPGFRTQPLETHVEVELDASGALLGEPRITRRSGNPWYDESVVRAIVKASPLPPPPKPGRWDFVFRPEDSF